MSNTSQTDNGSSYSESEPEVTEKPRIEPDDWDKLLKRVILNKKETDQFVMNFIVNKGLSDAAEALSSECDQTVPSKEKMEIATFRTKLGRLLLAKKFDQAIESIKSQMPQLNSVELFYRIKLLKMLHYIKREKLAKALLVAQNEIAQMDIIKEETLVEELKKVSLLPFMMDMKDAPAEYMRFLSDSFDTRQKKRIDKLIFTAVQQEEFQGFQRVFKQMRFSQTKLRQSIDFPAKMDHSDNKIEYNTDKVVLIEDSE